MKMGSSKELEFKKVVNNGNEEYEIIRSGKLVIRIDTALIDDTKREMSDWYTYLNNVIGLVSFTFALAVQGTPNVYANAFIALLWVLIAHYAVGTNPFPRHLRILRESDEEASRFAAKNIEKMHLGVIKTIRKAPLFLFGYLYLLLLALMNFKFIRHAKIGGTSLAEFLMLK